MKAIGLILAVIVFGGILSGIVFFATTIGWILAAIIIILCLCAGIISLVGQMINSICSDDSDDKNKGP